MIELHLQVHGPQLAHSYQSDADTTSLLDLHQMDDSNNRHDIVGDIIHLILLFKDLWQGFHY